MSDLTIAASITRDELSLADLDLEDPGVYRIVTAGPGTLTWRKQVATSPFVHGEFLVSAVKDVEQASLGIRCYGSSFSELQTNVAALLRAFEQFSYQLTITINGSTTTWDCEPAEYGPGDNWEPNLYRAKMQEYRFNIPRNPIPVAGPQ